MSSLRAEYELLKQVIDQHDYLYFEKQTPAISDDAYDILKRRLLWLASRLKIHIDKVGVTPNIPQITHDQRMLSLESNVGLEFFESWIARITADPYPIAMQHKVDGLAVSIKYLNGQLIYCATRGNGEVGEDITLNIQQVVPRVIPCKEEISVRGELYITKTAFASFQHHFSNARNAAAGIARKLNASVQELEMLSFAAYEVIGMDQDYLETVEFLSSLGFDVLDTKICANRAECIEAFNLIDRDAIKYVIDGAVFKVNSLELCRRLGYTSRAPRWAVACKFSPKESITRVCEIVFQVGRTGLVTPVLILEPTTIEGVVITRVSMHNLQLLKEKDVRINDQIIVTRAGDVIPYVKNVLYELRNQTQLRVELPKLCPSCESIIAHEGALSRCTNGWKCSKQAIGKLKYCFSALGIKELSDAHITRLYNLEIIQSFDDLFTLDLDQIVSLKGWGVKSWLRIQNQLHRPVKLAHAINALGIMGVGEVMSVVLAKRFQTWEKFIHKRNFDTIAGIGPKTAERIIQLLQNEQELLETFTKHLTIQPTEGETEFKETWVITGELSMPREAIKRRLEALGIKVQSDVSQKVSCLLCGEKPGSKLEKAKKLGIKIVGEEVFQELPGFSLIEG